MSGSVLLAIAYGLLVLGAIVALFGQWLPRANHTIALFGSFCAGGAAVAFALTPRIVLFGDKFNYGRIAYVASVGLTVMLVLWTMWISQRVQGRTREAVALAFFAVIGACVMASAREFVTFLVALELVAMPSFILVGYWAHRRVGLEATLKYFFISVMASMIMSYGISLIYGATGTTRMDHIDLSLAGPIGVMGLMMLLIGLLTKVSAAPFHFWAPDVYDGATAWSMAFVGTIAKAGATIGFISVVWMLYDQSEALAPVLAAISILSMVVGSFAALGQKRIRRILAYSGVVNAGYTIIALLAIEQTGERAIAAALVFTLTYALSVLGILFITATEGNKLKDLRGLSKRRPAAALALAIFALSLVGVPPLAGFFGKLFVFIVGFSSEYWFLVVLATIASVISAFYYLRLVKAAYFDKDKIAEKGKAHKIAKGYDGKPDLCANLAIIATALLVAGLIPLIAILGNLDIF